MESAAGNSQSDSCGLFYNLLFFYTHLWADFRPVWSPPAIDRWDCHLYHRKYCVRFFQWYPDVDCGKGLSGCRGCIRICIGPGHVQGPF